MMYNRCWDLCDCFPCCVPSCGNVHFCCGLIGPTGPRGATGVTGATGQVTLGKKKKAVKTIRKGKRQLIVESPLFFE